MKKTVLISFIILLAGCVSTKMAAPSGVIGPSQSDVDRVQSKFPDYTLTELNQGKALYEKHCGTCHALEKPASQTEEKWRKIVPWMSNKVNKKENNVLDQSAQDLILKYLITMSDSPSGKN